VVLPHSQPSTLNSLASAFFRMLAALFRDQSRATMVAGLAVLDFALYTG
jgi:hypothetical protein